jgi:predicted dienelactone hydrolase
MYFSQVQLSVNVGCHAVDATDPIQSARIPLVLLYPTRAPQRPEQLGPYALSLARDAPPDGEGLRLVVISHGTGGSSLVYRDLAVHLARAGFVVALPEHPGNNRDDNRLARTIANLENRPRHIRLAIDAAFADELVSGRLERDGVAVIGHSLGGYTALALAGGRPSALPHETADGQPRALAVTPDTRVRALVLLAPAAAWFVFDGALRDVDVPILMRTAERDEHAPAFHAEIIQRGVRDPARIDHRVIPNAGHFSFLSPFPPERTRPDFPPSQDPEGFDRATMHPVLNAEITAFLRDAIS